MTPSSIPTPLFAHLSTPRNYPVIRVTTGICTETRNRGRYVCIAFVRAPLLSHCLFLYLILHAGLNSAVTIFQLSGNTNTPKKRTSREYTCESEIPPRKTSRERYSSPHAQRSRDRSRSFASMGSQDAHPSISAFRFRFRFKNPGDHSNRRTSLRIKCAKSFSRIAVGGTR